MLLNQYQNYTQQWMHLERYVNTGSDHKYSRQSEVPDAYKPESSTPSFKIHALASNFSKTERLLPANLYPVHPFTASLYKLQGLQTTETNFEAIPTSSTRTLLVSDDHFASSFFVKLDLPVTISRFDRSINSSDVLFSQQINDQLATLKLKGPSNFGVFREIGGGHTNLNSGRKPGYLVRELRPLWLTSQDPGSIFLIPSFALISPDSKHPTHTPLLRQLLEHQAYPAQTLLHSILIPLVAYWFALADLGILWEMQQQNTLFAVNDKLEVVGVVIRDFDGAYIDVRRREELGLTANFAKHLLQTESQRLMRYSLIFDHRVCKQNILRIIASFGSLFSEAEAQSVKRTLVAYIDQCMPKSFKRSIPPHKWYSVPEILFIDGLETIVLDHPPLRPED